MKTIPVLPIRNTVILPGSALPLRIGRPQSVAAVERALKTGQLVLAVSQKRETEGDSVAGSDLFTVGTLSRIEKASGSPKEGYQIILRGLSRYRVNEYENEGGGIAAYTSEWKDA